MFAENSLSQLEWRVPSLEDISAVVSEIAHCGPHIEALRGSGACHFRRCVILRQ